MEEERPSGEGVAKWRRSGLMEEERPNGGGVA